MRYDYIEFQNMFSDEGDIMDAFLYIASKNDILAEIIKGRKFKEEDYINFIYNRLLQYSINEGIEYLSKKNIKSVIDDIDNKLTICHDSGLKEKNIIEIIDDFYVTTNLLKQINREGTKENKLLYEICYDYDYYLSTKDKIEQYVYQLINLIYYPFLEYFENLCEKHDIDLFAIQRKIGKYIIEDDEFDDLKKEYSNPSLPKQIVSETNNKEEKEYTTKYTKEQLHIILDALKEHKYIDYDTKFIHFLYVFTNKEKPENFKKLKWSNLAKNKDINKTQIICFCMMLLDLNLVDIKKDFYFWINKMFDSKYPFKSNNKPSSIENKYPELNSIISNATAK